MLIPGNSINSFKKDQVASQGNWFTGHMNTQELNFDPLVTGYAFIIWTKLPSWVSSTYKDFAAMTQKNFKAFEGISDIELQTGQYTHTFNGTPYEYALSIQKSNSNFSITHQEFSGSPIKNMYQFWVTGIRDPETDIALYPRAFGCEYGAKNHTGELLYVVTRPDANNVEKHNIEFAAYYTAVMPLKVPLAHLGYNDGDHNSPEININFVGDFHIGPEVDDFASDVLCGNVSTSSGFKDIVTPYSFITSSCFKPDDSSLGKGLYIKDAPSTTYNQGTYRTNPGEGNAPAALYTSDDSAQSN